MSELNRNDLLLAWSFDVNDAGEKSQSLVLVGCADTRILQASDVQSSLLARFLRMM